MNKKCSRGFSLVELVLVIGLIGILSLSVGLGVVKGFRAYELLWSRRVTLSEARMAMDRMVREIGLIENKGDLLDFTTSTRFNFISQGVNNITYDISDTNLRRNSDVIASGVSTLAFQYLDKNHLPTTNSNAMSRVQVEFTIDDSKGHGSITLRSFVLIRALGAYANFAEL